MATSNIQGNVNITGHLSAGSMTVPANTVLDDNVRSDADIEATKLQHQHQITRALSPHATAASTKREVLHSVYGATGTITSFSVGATVAPTGGDSVVVDLLKNGTTVLSGTVTLDSGNSNFVPEDGTVSVTSLVAGDVLEVNVSSVSGTTCKGLYARLVVREKASP